MSNLTKLAENIVAVCSQLNQGVSNRQVATSFNISRNVINTFVRQVEDLGISFDDVVVMPEEERTRKFFADSGKTVNSNFIEPDMLKVWEYLNKPNAFNIRHNIKSAYTRIYLADNKDATPDQLMSLRTFERRFHDYCKSSQHPDNVKEASCCTLTFYPGQCMEIDYVGNELKWISPDKVIRKAKVFTATLKYSGYLYARAVPDGTTDSWLTSIVEACKFFGGVPEVIRMDNDAALTVHGSKKNNTRTELLFKVRNLLDSLGTVGDLAPCRSPKYKASDERNNYSVESFFAAQEYVNGVPARDYTHLNEQLLQEVATFNITPRQSDGLSRSYVFEQYEKKALKPLPAFLPGVGDTDIITVPPDGYVYYKGNRYHAGNEQRSLNIIQKIENGQYIVFLKQDMKEIVRYKINPLSQGIRYKDDRFKSPAEKSVTRNRSWFLDYFRTHNESPEAIISLFNIMWGNREVNTINSRKFSAIIAHSIARGDSDLRILSLVCQMLLLFKPKTLSITNLDIEYKLSVGWPEKQEAIKQFLASMANYPASGTSANLSLPAVKESHLTSEEIAAEYRRYFK